jgi:hypothetical protein
VFGEPLRHHLAGIRDASRGHALVTLIEIASPSNKRPGPAAAESGLQRPVRQDFCLVGLAQMRFLVGFLGAQSASPLTSGAFAALFPRTLGIPAGEGMNLLALLATVGILKLVPL